MLHNFYVDDLLKSVETEELAIRLIKHTKAVCQADGFNLKKSISNKKVLYSISSRIWSKKWCEKCGSGYQFTIREDIASLPGQRKWHIQILNCVKRHTDEKKGDAINYKFPFWPPWICSTIYAER